MENLPSTISSKPTKSELERLDSRQLIALKSEFPDLVLDILLKDVSLWPYKDSCPPVDPEDIIYSSENIKVSYNKNMFSVDFLVGSNVTDAEIDASSQILSHIRCLKTGDYSWQPMDISTDEFIRILSHSHADVLYFWTPSAEEKVYELNAENIQAAHQIAESKANFHFGDRLQHLLFTSFHGNPLKFSTFAHPSFLKDLELNLYDDSIDIDLIVPFYNLKTLNIRSSGLLNGRNIAKLKSLEHITVQTELREMVEFPKSIRSINLAYLNFDVPTVLKDFSNLETLEIQELCTPELKMSNLRNLQDLKIPSITKLDCDKLTVKTLSVNPQALDSGVIDLPYLETLDLYESNVEVLDYSSYSSLKVLTVMAAESTDPSETVPLKMVKSSTLESLTIYTHIDNMLGVDCPSLTFLDINVSATCDISVEKCIALKHLNVEGLHFESDSKLLASLKHLKNIETINIRDSAEISSTECFKNLTTLLHLDLIKVGVEKLECLESLTSLKSLIIDSPKVKTIGNLPNSLQQFSCDVSSSTECNSADLPHLEFVNCDCGKISKIRLRRLEKMPTFMCYTCGISL